MLQKNNNVVNLGNHAGVGAQVLMMEQTNTVANTSESPNHHVNFSEANDNNTGPVLPEAPLVSSGQKSTPLLGTTAEITLLDERSLLACIVRTIPPGAGGKIRISSTVSGNSSS